MTEAEKRDVSSPALNEKETSTLPLKEKVDNKKGTIPYSEEGDVAGHGILAFHPQPVDDPLDPLNWTFFQKHGILAIVMAL
jgi:hypothetical protein